MSQSGGAKVALILKGWPRLSETFIAQEIAGLEARGIALELWSMRRPTDKARHPVHDRVRGRVTYLPEYLKDEPGRVFAAWLKDAEASEPNDPNAVALATVELAQRLFKLGDVWRHFHEQGQARAELHRIDATEDVLGCFRAMVKHRPHALQQAWAQHRMCKVRPRLVRIGETIAFGHRAAPKSTQLRQHEPHPVRAFASLAQFAQHGFVRVALGVHKALQVGDVVHGGSNGYWCGDATLPGPPLPGHEAGTPRSQAPRTNASHRHGCVTSN